MVSLYFRNYTLEKAASYVGSLTTIDKKKLLGMITCILERER